MFLLLFRKSDLNEGNLLEGVSSVSSLLARFETLVAFNSLVLSLSHLIIVDQLLTNFDNHSDLRI